MITEKIVEEEGEGEEKKADLVMEGGGEKPVQVRQRVKKERRGEEGRNLKIGEGYMYREGNWEIGRAAERAKVKVRLFEPGDRWVAWRKTNARKAKNAEKRSLTRKGGKGKSKK